MADKSTPLVLTALSRAAAAAAAVPLFGTKNVPGLFPGTAPGKQAAQRCRDEGLLSVMEDAPPEHDSAADGATTATMVRKKTASPTCTITDKGMQYLLSQVSPREVLEDFVRALHARQTEFSSLTAAARELLSGAETLKAHVARVLDQFPRIEERTAGTTGSLKALFREFLSDSPPAPAPVESPLPPLLVEELSRWQGSGSSEDCPLPHLYQQAKASHAGLTIGQFHDALRRLHDEGKVYLHPWTGPLYDLPEPPFTLMVGHEIAYYASLRR